MLIFIIKIVNKDSINKDVDDIPIQTKEGTLSYSSSSSLKTHIL